jgi:hypothetical protein
MRAAKMRRFTAHHIEAQHRIEEFLCVSFAFAMLSNTSCQPA